MADFAAAPEGDTAKGTVHTPENTSHSLAGASYFVVSKTRFVKRHTSNSPPLSRASLSTGAKIFKTKCAQCHVTEMAHKQVTTRGRRAHLSRNPHTPRH